MPSAPIGDTTRSLNRIAAVICVAVSARPAASGRGGSMREIALQECAR